MKTLKWILIILVCVIAITVILLLLRGDEDTWIRDGRGVWVKHGNPENTPSEVLQQQEVIKKANEIYQKAVADSTSFDNGPCLGKIADDWVVDTVHNPREEIDDRPGNQCGDYLQGKAAHFIELDLDGNIVRIN